MNARLERAFAAIDAANADDPNTLVVRGETRPKEQAHAEIACEWVARLAPDAPDSLQVAARAHHVRRWAIPRSDYPSGRSGYLRWRKALQKLHAETVREILTAQGWPREEIGAVEAFVTKRGLGRDSNAQVLEDVICLVFVETQLATTADRLADDRMVEVIAGTLAKMSDDGRAAAFTIELEGRDAALVARAAERHAAS